MAGQSWAVAVERHSSHSAWPMPCAMPLRFWAMDQHRVHRPATIIDRTIPNYFNNSGLGIDLHSAHDAGVRETAGTIRPREPTFRLGQRK
jgi:hypothetical protein